jgi:GAF domain-containing protein
LDDDGEIVEWFGTATDITDRVEYEQELESRQEQLTALTNLYATVQSVTHLAVQQSTRDEIERAVCETLSESDAYDFVWIGRSSRDGKNLTVRAAAGTERTLESRSISLDEDDPNSCALIAHAVDASSVQVARGDCDVPAFENWAREQEQQPQEVLVVPITHEGRNYGVLALYSGRSGSVDDVERETVRQLGDVVGHAIAATEQEKALVADQAVEVEYSSNTLAEPFAAAATGDEIRMTIDRIIPLPEGGALQYYTLTGITTEEYQNAVAKFSTVSNVRVLFDGERQSRVETRLTEDAMMSLIARFDGRVKTIRVENGELRMVVELPETTNVREVTEAINERYGDIQFVGHRTVERRQISPAQYRTVLNDSFTDRQRTMLESAFASGYFKWPRNVTAEELAEAHGIHPSTLHKHLRRAEKKLVATVFDPQT